MIYRGHMKDQQGHRTENEGEYRSVAKKMETVTGEDGRQNAKPKGSGNHRNNFSARKRVNQILFLYSI